MFARLIDGVRHVVAESGNQHTPSGTARFVDGVDLEGNQTLGGCGQLGSRVRPYGDTRFVECVVDGQDDRLTADDHSDTTEILALGADATSPSATLSADRDPSDPVESLAFATWLDFLPIVTHRSSSTIHSCRGCLLAVNNRILKYTAYDPGVLGVVPTDVVDRQGPPLR